MAANTNPLDFNNYMIAVLQLGVYQYSTVAGVITPTDATVATLPAPMLDYAELRIQRDLNLLPSLTSRSYVMATGNQQLTLSADDFVEIETVQAGGSSLLPVSKEYIQWTYPTGSTNGPPVYFAMIGGDLTTGGTTSNYILLAPPPDQNYPTTIYGRQRLPSLYKFANLGQASGNYTFLSTYYPDALIMASMIYISLYQRQFSAASDNSPGMAVNYEQQYRALVQGGMTEEQRKIFASGAWSSQAPTPIATPGR